MNTACIDIGTNTLLLLIVDDELHRVVDLCRFGRLGKGLDASGRLEPGAIANSLEICREHRAVMDEHGVTAPAAIATQAMREAKNAAEFVGPAEEILRAKIEIIGGTREAELAFVSVARTFPDLAGKPYCWTAADRVRARVAHRTPLCRCSRSNGDQSKRSSPAACLADDRIRNVDLCHADGSRVRSRAVADEAIGWRRRNRDRYTDCCRGFAQPTRMLALGKREAAAPPRWYR